VSTQVARLSRKIRLFEYTDALYGELHSLNDNLLPITVYIHFQPLDLSPPDLYESFNVAVRAINLWAVSRGYTVIKGRSKYRKNGGLIYKV
jgi:hypothetical protein